MESEQFSPESKVWIYQSSRPFNTEEIQELNLSLQQFATEWTAHQVLLSATGYVYRDRIIVLMVDETRAGASGCSIDISVRFIKSLEDKYHTELFNRMLVNYLDGSEIITTTLSEIHNLDKNTSVINPLVKTKEELANQFIMPLHESWMMQYA